MAPSPSPDATAAVDERYGRLADRLRPLARRLRSRVTVDARSLAALRVVLGLLLLGDLLHRASHLGLFYTDAGVYPRAANEAVGGEYVDLSLHALSGEPVVQAALFAVAGGAALSLVVGYRTRTVAVVSLLLLFSLHLRNPAVLNGGDRLLRVLLLVALLTPLGERWSVDALRRGEARERVTGPGVVALLLQPVAVFATNASLKAEGETWYAGEAVAVAFANDAMTHGLADRLAAHPDLLTAGNWAWVALLAGAPVLLLATAGRTRAAVVGLYVGAFAGMAATLAVGLFPFVLTASVLPYLTAPVWDAAARHVPDRLEDLRPSAAALGPFAKPPLERRALAALRGRGHGRAADYAAEYARSLGTLVGVLAVIWIGLFAGSHVAGVDLPESVVSQAPDTQRWGLYAPDPSSSYSWYVAEATLADGRTVDALDGGPATLDRPPDAGATYETFRHRKFMSSVDDDGPLAERYAAWACGRVDETADVPARSVTLYRVTQYDTTAEDLPRPAVLELVEREC